MSIPAKRLRKRRSRFEYLPVKVVRDRGPEPSVTHVVSPGDGCEEFTGLRISFPQTQNCQRQRFVRVRVVPWRAACRVAKELDGGIV